MAPTVRVVMGDSAGMWETRLLGPAGRSKARLAHNSSSEEATSPIFTGPPQVFSHTARIGRNIRRILSLQVSALSHVGKAG